MKDKVFSYLIKWLLQFWFLFIRQEIYIPPETEKLLDEHGGFILAGWHNQILLLTHHVSRYVQKKRKVMTTPLVSLSKDGELTYQTFLRFNMVSVRGSTSRGGSTALRSILKTMKEGKVPIFTPDGPRGPVYKIQPGVVQMAAMTGLPVVSFFSTCDRYYETRSWDKHRFPKFFAKQYIEYSKPFYVPKGEKNPEEYVQKLEDVMMDLVNKVDAHFSPKTENKEDAA
ncbi:MAG: lysophospholipid acyltransferase family protein [Leptospiraceae bacterium]|nr:lysophospholipid acyltransferase family protein [Leptospiraceae bacterium]